MIANENKSYHTYLNRLVDQYISTYHHSITKKLLMLIILLRHKKWKWFLKLLNLQWMIESELLSIRIFLVKVTLKVGHEKYLFLILFGKLILWLIKYSNGEKITGSLYKKELLQTRL